MSKEDNNNDLKKMIQQLEALTVYDEMNVNILSKINERYIHHLRMYEASLGLPVGEGITFSTEERTKDIKIASSIGKTENESKIYAQRFHNAVAGLIRDIRGKIIR